MGAVFVSYRRGDSEGQARALSIELGRLVGKQFVFMDVDGIALGRDFRQVLQERLNSCDLMLALIGPGWLDAKDNTGGRRLDSANDFVRQEIAAALKRNIPVVPVLVQGAQVPPADRLPDDLKDLSYRNGFELGHSTWESDIREMAGRLGLLTPRSDAAAAAAPIDGSPPASTLHDVKGGPARRVAAVAIVAVIIGAAALFTYDRLPRASVDTAQPTPSSPATGPANDAVAVRAARGLTTTPLGAEAPTLPEGPAASALELLWPGGDCWDIFRGGQSVTFQCGTARQALSAGAYVIKGRGYAVFEPFEVQITAGTTTRIAKGGVFAFDWPGGDCWDVFRGTAHVTFQCGAKQQALGAGRYTIKGRGYPVFRPIEIEIRDGAKTRLVSGGVLKFNWPGPDCWDVFRGSEFVTFQCGSKSQTLGAGTYTIKGRDAAVFEPFDVTIKDGVTVVRP